MTTQEILINARALIEDEENWCQANFRRNGKRCVYGAIIDAWDGVDEPSYIAAVHALKDQVPGRQVTYFNDNHTHAEVLELFDSVIVPDRELVLA